MGVDGCLGMGPKRQKRSDGRVHKPQKKYSRLGKAQHAPQASAGGGRDSQRHAGQPAPPQLGSGAVQFSATAAQLLSFRTQCPHAQESGQLRCAALLRTAASSAALAPAGPPARTRRVELQRHVAHRAAIHLPCYCKDCRRLAGARGPVKQQVRQLVLIQQLLDCSQGRPAGMARVGRAAAAGAAAGVKASRGSRHRACAALHAPTAFDHPPASTHLCQ